MSRFNDLKILYHLSLKPIRGATQQQRLENFYSGQAVHYDEFRKRLLHGREELYRGLPLKENAVWVDFGGGTGSQLETVADQIGMLEEVCLVDLSTSLLNLARQRVQRNQWSNVRIVEDDVRHFTPSSQHADLVTFSYSLTMIPDWIGALEQARKILKPGGHIGLVDFYVSHKYPEHDLRRHAWFTRTFCPAWFAMDNVFLSPDHLAWLRRNFQTVRLEEKMARIPYMPGLRVPYYLFLGRL